MEMAISGSSLPTFVSGTRAKTIDFPLKWSMKFCESPAPTCYYYYLRRSIRDTPQKTKNQGCHQETKGQEKGRLKIKPQMAMEKKDLKMAMTKMDTVKIPVPQFNLSFQKF